MLSAVLAGVDTAQLRKHCENRLEQLRVVRQPWLDYCRAVAEELMPSRLPYLLDPHGNQRAGEQNRHIVDAVGHLSLDTAAAGITSGIMPMAAPWFALGLRDDEAKFDLDHQGYLQSVAKVQLAVHNQSNVPHVLPESIKEWLAFGTGAAMVHEDERSYIRLEAVSVGEYLIADDERGRVDTCYRLYSLTVGQLAQEFGVEQLSASSRQHHDNGHMDVLVPIVQAIEPDEDGRNPLSVEGMPWRSVYYEQGSDTDQVLDVRGYAMFPVLVWRWGKLGGSAYGYGRGHDALPHLERLRKMIYSYNKAVALKADPPTQIPPGLQPHEVRRLPGQSTTVFGSQPVTPLFQVQLELRELAEQIERTRQDIRDTLGATLVASLRRIQRTMTAREADLRRSEDLAEFLPGLARLNEELLAPYIEWLYAVAWDRGLLPEPPPSMDGLPVDIEFRSPLALRQRQSEVDAIVRVFSVASEMAKVPQLQHVLDNLDVDRAIRLIAEIEGAPADVLVLPDSVAQVRQARLQMQMAQTQQQAAQQGVDLAQGVAEVEAA